MGIYFNSANICKYVTVATAVATVNKTEKHDDCQNSPTMGSGLTKYQSLEAAKPDDNSCLDSVFTVSMTDVLCELTAVTYNRLQSLQTRHFLIIYDIPDYVDRTIEVIDRYFRNSLVDKCGVKADDIKINIPLKSIPSSGGEGYHC